MSSGLTIKAEALLKEKYKVKRLSAAQKDIAFSIVKQAVTGNEIGSWDAALASFIKDEKPIEEIEILGEIAEIAQEYDLDSYNAAVLRHSKKLKK